MFSLKTRGFSNPEKRFERKHQEKKIYLANAPIAFKSSYAPCNLFTVLNSAWRIHALGS